MDPHISKHLRLHQRQGVEFLYKAVYLNTTPPNYIGGAILADDMGLGKTLQCIALLWYVKIQNSQLEYNLQLTTKIFIIYSYNY